MKLLRRDEIAVLAEKNGFRFDHEDIKNKDLVVFHELAEWFRTEHNIHIVILPKVMFPDNMTGSEYHYELYHNDEHFQNDDVTGYHDAWLLSIAKAFEIIGDK